jgi:hypothetical protein
VDETTSVDYSTKEAAEQALRWVLDEAKEGLEARIERHGDAWRLILHHNDGEDDTWMVTRLETF